MSNIRTRRLLRHQIIKHIFGRADFIGLLEEDSFVPTKQNVALKINEYAAENWLWDEILIGDHKEFPVAMLVKDLKNFEDELDAFPLAFNKRRNTIISIIHSDDWLNEYHEFIGIAIRDVRNENDIFKIIGETVNEYAIKHNIWKENVSISILKNDVRTLYLKGKIALRIKARYNYDKVY
ncbi:MAG: hypothetical protein ACREA5_03700 [Nitrosotalea sp.]